MLKRRKQLDAHFFRRVEPALENRSGAKLWARYEGYLWQPLSTPLYKELERRLEEYIEQM